MLSRRRSASISPASPSGSRENATALNLHAGRAVMPLRNFIAAIHPRLAVVLHDMLMVWLAWTAVSALRWSLAPNPSPVSLFGPEVWLVLGAQGVIFWWTGLYRGLWRFASVPDIWNIFRACLLGAFAVAITLFLYNRLVTVPRTVLVVYPFVLA